MINSLIFGKVIYSRLTTINEDLKELIGTKVFPLIADNNTDYPFVVYKRTGVMNNDETKDGYSEDVVNYEVVIVSNKYEESLNIAQMVRNLLERKRIESDIMTIYDTKLTLATEEYSGDAYVQKLTFNCKIN